MSQEPTTVIGMPRPTWEPKTAEQRAALAAIDQAVAEAQRVEAEAEARVRQAVEAARKIGIPVRAVVERVGASRATLYRRNLGKRPDGGEGASSS